MASTVSNGNDRFPGPFQMATTVYEREICVDAMISHQSERVSQGGDDFCFVVNAPLKLTLVICSVAWGRATVAFTMVCCTFAN